MRNTDLVTVRRSRGRPRDGRPMRVLNHPLRMTQWPMASVQEEGMRVLSRMYTKCFIYVCKSHHAPP